MNKFSLQRGVMLGVGLAFLSVLAGEAVAQNVPTDLQYRNTDGIGYRIRFRPSPDSPPRYQIRCHTALAAERGGGPIVFASEGRVVGDLLEYRFSSNNPGTRCVVRSQGPEGPFSPEVNVQSGLFTDETINTNAMQFTPETQTVASGASANVAVAFPTGRAGRPAAGDVAAVAGAAVISVSPSTPALSLPASGASRSFTAPVVTGDTTFTLTANAFLGNVIYRGTAMLTVTAPPLAAVANVQAQVSSGGRFRYNFRVQWTAMAGASGYDVQYAATAAAIASGLIQRVTATSVTQTTRAPSRPTRFYRVRAVADDATGPWSSPPVQATTAPLITAPPAPAGFAAAITTQALANTVVNLSWDAPATNPEFYRLSRRDPSGTRVTLEDELVATARAYVDDSTPKLFGEYSYALDAVNAGGSMLATATVTIDAPPVPPVVILPAFQLDFGENRFFDGDEVSLDLPEVARGDQTPIVYSIIGGTGNFPAGLNSLTFNAATRTLTGTVNAPDGTELDLQHRSLVRHEFIYRATDARGNTADLPIVIAIAPPADGGPIVFPPGDGPYLSLATVTAVATAARDTITVGGAGQASVMLSATMPNLPEVFQVIYTWRQSVRRPDGTDATNLPTVSDTSGMYVFATPAVLVPTTYSMALRARVLQFGDQAQVGRNILVTNFYAVPVTFTVFPRGYTSAVVANAGDRRTVQELEDVTIATSARERVTLDGRASRSESGVSISYSWVQVDPTSNLSEALVALPTSHPTYVALTGATTSQPHFEVPAVLINHVLAFDLTVASGTGANEVSDRDRVFITVQGNDDPPIAVFTLAGGLDITMEVPTDATVTLDSTGSRDPEGLPISFRWDELDVEAGAFGRRAVIAAGANDDAMVTVVLSTQYRNRTVPIPPELVTRDGRVIHVVLAPIPYRFALTVLDGGLESRGGGGTSRVERTIIQPDIAENVVINANLAVPSATVQPGASVMPMPTFIVTPAAAAADVPLRYVWRLANVIPATNVLPVIAGDNLRVPTITMPEAVDPDIRYLAPDDPLPVMYLELATGTAAGDVPDGYTMLTVPNHPEGYAARAGFDLYVRTFTEATLPEGFVRLAEGESPPGLTRTTNYQFSVVAFAEGVTGVASVQRTVTYTVPVRIGGPATGVPSISIRRLEAHVSGDATVHRATNMTVNFEPATFFAVTDGSPVTLNWEVTSVTPLIPSYTPAFVDATSHTPRLTIPGSQNIPGETTIIATWTATASGGLSATGTVTLRIVPLGTGVAAPRVTANAGAGVQAVSDTNVTVTLAGSGSVSDGSRASFLWEYLGIYASASDILVAPTDSDTPTFLQRHNPRAVFTMPAGVPVTTSATNRRMRFRLTVGSGHVGAALATSIVDLTVVAANTPPVANAGSDQLITPAFTDTAVTVNLVGTASVDSDAITYLWEQITTVGRNTGGTQFTQTNTANARIIFSGSSLNTPVFIDETFRLTTTTPSVSDAFGIVTTDSDTVKVSVNFIPTAEATFDDVDAGRGTVNGKNVTLTNVTVGQRIDVLTASASDRENDDLRYQWTLTSPTSGVQSVIALNNAGTGEPSFSVPALPTSATTSATLTFALTVSDGISDSPTDTVTVTLNYADSANSTPVVTAVSNPPTTSGGVLPTVDEGGTVMLIATARDADPLDTLTYSWAITAPGVIRDLLDSRTTIANPTSASTQVTLPVVEGLVTMVFAVTVSDGAASSTTSVLVVVRSTTNDQPIAVVADDDITIRITEGVASPLRVTLDGSGSSDADAVNLRYQWTQPQPAQGPGAGIRLINPSGAVAEFIVPTTTNNEPRTINRDVNLRFVLRVIDSEFRTPLTERAGQLQNVSVRVIHINRTPSAMPTVAKSPVAEGETVTLIGGGTDPDGQALTYIWEQGGNANDPRVTLLCRTGINCENDPNPTFVAPSGFIEDVTLRFVLRVDDGEQRTGPEPGEGGSRSPTQDGSGNALGRVNVVVIGVDSPPTITATSRTPSQPVVESNTLVTLMATATDADSADDAISFTWTQTAPPIGPAANVALNFPDTNNARATFTTPGNVLVDTDMVFTVVAHDALSTTPPTELRVRVRGNLPPEVVVTHTPTGDLDITDRVTLDARASSDSITPSDDLTFTWRQIVPRTGPGTGVLLTYPDTSRARAVFTVPSSLTVPTYFGFEVIANDGLSDSRAATYSVLTDFNNPPTASVRVVNSNITEGDRVTLSAENSIDPDNPEQLTFTWRAVSGRTASGSPLTLPTESDFSYTNVRRTRAIFTTPVEAHTGRATLVLETIAFDGISFSQPARVTVTYAAVNSPPAAGEIALTTTTGQPLVVPGDPGYPGFPRVITGGVCGAEITCTVHHQFGLTVVREGHVLHLNGTSSTDLDGGELALSYSWSVSGDTRGANFAFVPNPNDSAVHVTMPDVWTADTTLTFRLTVSDGQASNASTVRIHVLTNNDPPTGVNIVRVSHAGRPDLPDNTRLDLPENTRLVLRATASDPERQSVSYRWSLNTDRTPAAYHGALNGFNTNSPTLSFTLPDVDETVPLWIVLTATDAGGASSETVEIVNVVSEEPIAVVGGRQTVNEGATVTLTGRNSRDNQPDQTLIYLWTQSDTGPDTGGDAGKGTVTFIQADVSRATFVAPTQLIGDITIAFLLTVTDSGGTASVNAEDATTEIVVRAAGNDAPVVGAGDALSADSGREFTLDANVSARDPEGEDLTTFLWRQTAPTSGLGSDITLSATNTATVTFTPPQLPIDTLDLRFELTVTDARGLSGTGIVRVTVNAGPNIPPVATATVSPLTASKGNPINLTGNTSEDPEGGALTYAWSYEGNALIARNINFADATAANTTFPAPDFLTETELTVTLTVTDGRDDTDTATVTVTVRADGTNDAPLANAGDRQSADEDTTVTLDGSESNDPESQPLTFAWTQTSPVSGSNHELADLTLSDAAAAKPTFTVPNVRTGALLIFSLRVNDGVNNSAPTTVTVQVTADDDPPTVNAGTDRTVAAESVVRLLGRGNDPEGIATTYRWVQTAPTSGTGVGVAITNSDQPVASFTTPTLTDEETVVMTFRLIVTVNVTKTVNGVTRIVSSVKRTDDVTFTVVTIPQVDPTFVSEVARTIVTGTISSITQRIDVASVARIPTPSFKFGGRSSLAGALQSHGTAMTSGTRDWRDVLRDTEFVIPLSANLSDDDNGGAFATAALWGSGDYRQMESEDATTEWKGNLTGLHIGVDTRLDSGSLLGVAVSRTTGDFDYVEKQTTTDSTYDINITSVHPYFDFELGAVDAWVLGGVGTGELERRQIQARRVAGEPPVPDPHPPVISDIKMRTYGFGGSGQLWGDDEGGIRFKAEFSGSSFEVDVPANTGGTAERVDGSNSLARLVLEGSRSGKLDGGGTYTQAMEAGVRNDGGDGNAGRGSEIAGSARYSNPVSGFSAEWRAHALLGHTGDYDEWGMRGSFRLQPGDDGQGLSFAFNPGYGATGSGSKIWGELPDQFKYANDDDDATADYEARLDARIGYGIPLAVGGKHGLLTPYTASTLGSTDTYRLGLNWKTASKLDLTLLGKSTQSTTETDNTLLLKGELSF